MKAEEDRDADKPDGQGGGMLADGKAGDDVRRVPGLGRLGDFPHRGICWSRYSNW